jgi:V/A-type H+/Na+-transporting ATPase subunit I
VIRPRAARWFEILAARDDATLALEALASTGAVELEARPAASLLPEIAEARPLLLQFRELAQRYRPYWPVRGLRPSAFPEAPALQLARDLARVRAWAQDAEPAVQELQRGDTERAELALWQRVIDTIGDSPVDWSALAAAGPVLQARLFVFPPGALALLPEAALVRRIEMDTTGYALVVGRPDELDPVVVELDAAKGRACEPPPWLLADAGRNAAYVAAREAVLARRADELASTLEALHAKHDLPAALGDANRLQWMMENVHALEAGDLFCWITGWTSDLAGRTLAKALDRSGARALLHFPAPPSGAHAPLLLANPRWARPFEVFSRALGMPARDEVDPSVILAVTVPLLFGYMFGDVGQGLVLMAAGLYLRRRWPLATLIVAGGASATVFGMLFGSVFGLHLLVPLWIAPLDDPLTILLVPLAGGAFLLVFGLLLAGVEAYWREALVPWLAADLGFAIAYLGILAAALDRAGLVVAAAGALWFCIGRAVIGRRSAAALAALAELIERLVQILINTLSFARVGAFALAHAGLSSAIVALMHASDSLVVRALVLVAGNVVVLVLEALVVSIQTTRLVLFEFFTRFLHAEGRVFRPLPTPPSWQER